MKILPATTAESRAVQALGLDSDVLDLSAIETIACALRRTGAFLCPCSGATLIRGTLDPFYGLQNLTELRPVVEETLEALVAHGDFLELKNPTQSETNGAMLYTAPPSFVPRTSGAVFIIGVAPDDTSPLPDDLQHKIEFNNHLRTIPAGSAEDLIEQLEELGLIRIPFETWLKIPTKETADVYLKRVQQQLGNAQHAGEIPGLIILDPSSRVDYYPGRWTEPMDRTGQFVARRPQAFGSDLWSFVEIEQGRPSRFVDLPLRDIGIRGCDEAWRLQSAIDYTNGKPQYFRRRHGSNGSSILDFYSPIPMWARRRWNAIGEPVVPSGCLFSYKFSESEVEEEIRFAREHLWLVEKTPSAY